MVIDALPRRKVVRHRPPGDAAPQHVKQRIDDLAQRVGARTAARIAGALQQRSELLPLRIRQVGWVAFSFHATQYPQSSLRYFSTRSQIEPWFAVLRPQDAESTVRTEPELKQEVTDAEED
jgi:hypothetical protein